MTYAPPIDTAPRRGTTVWDRLVRITSDRPLSRELVATYSPFRIEQAFDQLDSAMLNGDGDGDDEDLSTPSVWIVRCLREDWVAFSLFDHAGPIGADDVDQRYFHLGHSKQGCEYRNRVRVAIESLNMFTFRRLVSEVVCNEGDLYHKEVFFRNPTLRNWILCEKVYSRHKREITP